MPRKKRALTAEETTLWNKVIKQVETVESMPPLTIQHPPKPVKLAKPEPSIDVSRYKLGVKHATKPAQTHHTPSFNERAQKTSPNMDRRSFQRLLKGRLEIDATLDLHGLTADQARMQLQIFVSNAHRMQNRLILVITGKGNTKWVDEFNRPKSGVLKTGVPDWLKNGPKSNLVLQVMQAHDKHGGGGAFYVYLRRRRTG